MVMIRKNDKAYKVAKSVMKGKGIKVRSPSQNIKTKNTGAYLQH